MENIIVFGAGEFGTLVTNVLSYIDQYQIVAFGDDDRQKAGQTLAGLPVFSTVDIFEFAETKKITTAIMAIGNNRARAEKYELFTTSPPCWIVVLGAKSCIGFWGVFFGYCREAFWLK